MADEPNNLGYHWRRSAGLYDAPAPKAEAPPEEEIPAEVEEPTEDEPVEGEKPAEAKKPEATPPSDPNTLWAPKPTKKTK